MSKAEQLLRQWGIRCEYGRTAKIGMAEWWRGLSPERVQAKLRIAEALPVFLRFWCCQPYVGLCEMRVFGQTVEECAMRAVEYTARYHFRSESRVTKIIIRRKGATTRKVKR